MHAGNTLLDIYSLEKKQIGFGRRPVLNNMMNNMMRSAGCLEAMAKWGNSIAVHTHTSCFINIAKTYDSR